MRYWTAHLLLWVAPLAGCALTPGPSAAVALGDDRRAQMERARTLARSGARGQARAIYDAMLTGDPEDDEARAGLARLDAWEGRWEEAVQGYRAVLARHPADLEVRAGLVDVLLWQRHLDEAEREIRAGLALDGRSPLFHARLARLHHWRGDAEAAAASADRAERLAPDDAQIREMRDRIQVGEARFGLRNDTLPGGAVGFRALDLGARHTWRRWTFAVRTQQMQRIGPAPDAVSYNALYFVEAGYPLAVGTSAEVELGLGAPADDIPRFLGRVSGVMPLGTRFSAYAAYALWAYTNGQVVQILNPAVGLMLGDALTLRVRYWFAFVTVPPPQGTAGALLARGVQALGVQASYRPTSRIELQGEIVHGAQLERTPQIQRLTEVPTETASVSLDWLITRAFGLRPQYRLELRSPAAGVWVPFHTLELALYLRW